MTLNYQIVNINNTTGTLKSFLLSAIILSSILIACYSSPAYAQFGKNKVQYRDFDWKVLKTEHFDVYFYEKERPMVVDAARIAERAYTQYSHMLNFEHRRKIPLILYASQSDFQQTNVLPGDISEGIAGVNEFLKRRMVMPFTGSWKDMEHTLTHELAHAFQIDIIWGEGAPVANPFAYSPPLWFIEGMVEELSLGKMTTDTEMWLRDAALAGYLMTLEELSYMPDLRAYRFGHSFWYYIDRKYGSRKIGEILQKTPFFGNVDRAFKSALGADLKTLGNQWHEDIRKTYLPMIVSHSKPEDFSRALTKSEGGGGNYNVTPALDPTGQKLAFISNRSGYIDIWTASAIDGEDRKKLVEGQRNPDFESFRFLYTSLDWSPDGRYITFVAKSGPVEAVYVMATFNENVVHKFKYDELDGVLSPSFSPDGKKIVFSGIKGGASNLFEIEIETGKLTQLTDDRYTQREPTYSPDGKTIAFTTERGPGTDLNKLIFSDYRIGLLEVGSGEYTTLPNSFGDNHSPQWSPEGTKLAYVSNRTGIPNIFYHDFSDGKEYQVTDILTGVTGPTENSPCLSWSEGSGRLAYSAFYEGAWNIYVINSPEIDASLWLPDTTLDFEINTVHMRSNEERIQTLKEELREQADTVRVAEGKQKSEIQDNNGKKTNAPAIAPLADYTAVASELEVPDQWIELLRNDPIAFDTLGYADSLETLDAIAVAVADSLEALDALAEEVVDSLKALDSVNALENVSADSSMAQDSLSEVMSATAMLDSTESTDSSTVAKVDTLPSISFEFNEKREDIPLPDTTLFKFGKYKLDFSVDYVSGYGGYQGNIGFNGGAMVSLSDELGNHNMLLGANFYSKIQDSDVMFQYTNLEGRTDVSYFVSQFRDVYYLSSVASSDEYFANIWRSAGVFISRPFDRFRRLELGLTGYSVSQKTFEISFYDIYYYNQYVERNTEDLGTYFFGGPRIAYVFDNTAYGYTGPVDGTRYRLSFQYLLGDLQYGEAILDARKYWYLWRYMTFAVRGIAGSRFGESPQIFYIGGPYTYRGAGYGDLRGHNIVLGNAELRFPLIHFLYLGFPPVALRGIMGSLFFDVAGAWRNDEGFQPFTTRGAKWFNLRDMQAAYGFGIRTNLGFLIFRYDIAQNLDHYETRYYQFDNRIYETSEKVEGRRRYFFSIGSDF